MSRTRLHDLADAGQSVWLDFIDRTSLRDGSLARRIREQALTGMTSNPTIFEKALSEGSAYDEQVSGAPAGLTTWQLFELVEADDVRSACDLFREVYTASRGADGYVSIEVSPGVANSASDTVAEARRLWAAVDRPNVMIKVPGTEEGSRAVQPLIADGINVNVTLLFSVQAYARIIEAYLSGLEERAARNLPLEHVASVASFFVSRVDTEVDARLEKLAVAAPSDAERLRELKGRTAVANAKLAYRLFQQKFSGARWGALAGRGAQMQRPLWASTSTKNPAFRDVMYVEQLIGPHTVNTMPPATFDAFLDHGETRRTVDDAVDGAERHIAALEAVGIPLAGVTDKLLVDGLASFQHSFDGLLAGLARRTGSAARPTATAAAAAP